MEIEKVEAPRKARPTLAEQQAYWEAQQKLEDLRESVDNCKNRIATLRDRQAEAQKLLDRVGSIEGYDRERKLGGRLLERWTSELEAAEGRLVSWKAAVKQQESHVAGLASLDDVAAFGELAKNAEEIRKLAAKLEFDSRVPIASVREEFGNL